jgi:membrane protein
MAAVGFEVLKIAGTYTIAATAQSPTLGPFAGVLAVLVWIQLVTRWTLFCAAWMAEVSLEPSVPAPQIEPEIATDEQTPEIGPSPAAVGAGLIGAGVVAGAAVTAYAMHRRTPGDA